LFVGFVGVSSELIHKVTSHIDVAISHRQTQRSRAAHMGIPLSPPPHLRDVAIATSPKKFTVLVFSILWDGNI
jgi:hypothetical protein